jgi:hypothetical protein
MAEPIKADVGFIPEALDPAITAARDRLTKVIADVERIRGTLEPQLDAIRQRLTTQLTSETPDATVMANADRLIEWLEKYARVALNFTKVVDEAARLRSFIAGGSDSRPDLGTLSDADLMKRISAVKAKVE